MGVKVSVVMPVSNPGLTNDAFGASVRSVLEQSLPPEEYEIVFADDGSTDGTRRRLDAIAAQRSNVRVLHLDRSESPVRGRNVGLSVARGEYVYLLNQYDRLEPDALQRMYGVAAGEGADIVVGRLADGGPPQPAFARTRGRADIVRDHLLGLSTGHKLISRELVEAAQLRFPDRPLSEQAFATRAYLSARAIAVVADRICCHLGPADDECLDPEALFEGINGVFDVVEALTAPGTRRERVLAHWYRTLGLRRLGGGRFLASSADERALLFSFLRRLTLDRVPESLDVHLPVHLRARAALLRQDRPEALLELAEASRGTRLSAELRDVRWDDGVLALDLGVEILQPDGGPMWLREEDGRLLWSPPAHIPGLLPQEMTDVTDAVRRARVEVFLREARTGVTYALPAVSAVGRAAVGGRVRVWATAQTTIDVASAALGSPLAAGLWEVHVRMRGVRPGRARVFPPDVATNCAGTLVGEPPRLVVPCWSERDEFGVCVEPRSFAESVALVSSRTTVARQEGHVFVVMPVPYVPPSGGPAAELMLREQDGRGRSMIVPALVEPGVPGRVAGQLVARVPLSRIGGEECLGPGSWRAALRIDQKDVELRFGLTVGRGGRVAVRPAGSPSAPPLLRRVAVRVLGDGGAVRLARAVRGSRV
ncbi:glycosyltransferase family 2 protein [Microbispora sp. RL4-1S]|uniref:Glycosyltransferase family 2 protein n=1 Tax=Microbispora oryzae TaxID=2806554 RepID=A0A940WLH2_9ACTN|nr:glycosyltransferase family 2 protein [Microbispora oryzae]MBP2707138.1 glycosyltransferase family 2 protein [Microbispora oryzae]